ncbi:DUF1028 domain-containing protein [Conexibacter sp. DBS9H8]|uniref:DUF1028 domain-containing protein n=1 Tax=Conexibacter sp. DBS9H8 TaxID=2937801 RepID=UPI00200DAA22|nr:DUF1028 domain-containing protein [Conexibacter sp. DBS9H8]
MTYSIVARDPDTGEFGVAVQSHYFSVGPVVPWARPGVGAVATQAMAELSFGPRGLDLMATGVGAPTALAALLVSDEGSASRQVALVDATGEVAAHTGENCIVHAGHAIGAGVSCQANIMVSDAIWGAMLEAYEHARSEQASMARRLLAALNAAEALGGDARGRQSAALLVVPASGEPWEREVDLRVEDDPEPLQELERLLVISEAYRFASRADDQLVGGDTEAAGALFEAALERLPDSHELKFWAGLSLAHAGDVSAGAALVKEAIAVQSGWSWLLPRLTEQQAPGATAVSAHLGL